MEPWPELPLAEWRDTYATLHMWTQIVGKIRMAQTPLVNHWWNVTLYVSACGLTTGPIPCGDRTFEIAFDFVNHRLTIEVTDGQSTSLALKPRTVAAFYSELMAALQTLGIRVRISPIPQEVPERTPFPEDEAHRSYDPEYANRHWRILAQTVRVFTDFRSRFLGKVSPIHWFWGSFDLAMTRFSGRRAPEHPGGGPLPLWITREAYSHECSSAGFWPGGGPVEDPVFYAYAYPEPPGFAQFRVRPDRAYYHPEMREFLLPYDAVRLAGDPDQELLQFLQTSYEAAAERGGWNRAELERSDSPAGKRA